MAINSVNKQLEKENSAEAAQSKEENGFEEKVVESLSENLELFSKENLSRYAMEPIETGFSQYDELVGGINSGLTILGAESGLGKSTIAFQIAEQIALNKKYEDQPILIFSMEMSALQINAKAVSRGVFRRVVPDPFPNDYTEEKCKKDGAVTAGEIMSKKSADKFDDSVWENIDEVRSELQPYTKNIHIYKRLIGGSKPDHKVISENVLEFIRKNKDMKKPLVIIDYLQILSAGDAAFKLTQQQIIDKNVKELSSLARIVPVLLISSMNRDSYKKETKDMSSFKGSGDIEYTADTLLSLSLAKRSSKSDFPRTMRLTVLKQRYGAADIEIPFKYYSAFDCFVEADEPIRKNNSLYEYSDTKKKTKKSDFKTKFRKWEEVIIDV